MEAIFPPRDRLSTHRPDRWLDEGGSRLGFLIRRRSPIRCPSRSVSPLPSEGPLFDPLTIAAARFYGVLARAASSPLCSPTPGRPRLYHTNVSLFFHPPVCPLIPPIFLPPPFFLAFRLPLFFSSVYRVSRIFSSLLLYYSPPMLHPSSPPHPFPSLFFPATSYLFFFPTRLPLHSPGPINFHPNLPSVKLMLWGSLLCSLSAPPFHFL